MTALDGRFNNAKKAMTALDGCFSTSDLGAEWYKKACTIAIRLFFLQVLNTGGREDGILHWMWEMVP